MNVVNVGGFSFLMSDANSTSYIFNAEAQDDSAEVQRLLASQQAYVERHAPIRRYVFDSNIPGANHPIAPVPGMPPIAYRIESLSDPAPDEDIREMIRALTGGVDLSSFRKGVGQGSASTLFSCPRGGYDPGAYQPGDEELEAPEVVIDANGQPRHAGATTPEGEYIRRFKRRAEESLFIFLRGILGRFFLTSHFHKKACHWLQQCPPFRKLKLMPREHAKTTIVAGGLPPHILIQSADTNIYFPGINGCECRILLGGETETMAKKNLRVVQSVFEENRVFRALWPERVWEGRAKSQSKMWSDSGIIIPRENEWPDPTIRAVGVGGAITGARPNVLIKDDLISFKAANSEVVMDEAIEWHKASRALLDKYEIESGLQSLEFIIGTRWSVYDLYSYIIDNDPSVEINDESFHRIIRDGKILWPEKYSVADIEQLQREHGSNFYLLYLNTPADPSLVDFDTSQIRVFSVVDGKIVFFADERDLLLEKKHRLKQERLTAVKPPANVKAGERLTASVLQRMIDGGGGMRLRAT